MLNLLLGELLGEPVLLTKLNCSGGYFYWDIEFLLKPDTPISVFLLNRYVETQWPSTTADPGILPFRLDGVLETTNDVGSFGWKCLTEPQLRLAPILACARDIRDGQVSEIHMLQWRRTFLTVSGRLQLMPDPKDWVFRSLTANMQLSNQAETATPTTLQRIIEIGKHRKEMESKLSNPVSHQDVFNDYNENIRVQTLDPDADNSIS